MGAHDMSDTDPLLLPFLAAEDSIQIERESEPLIDIAHPIVKRATRNALNPQDAYQQTILHLLQELHELRQRKRENSGDDDGIRNYLGYVSVTASRVVSGEIRALKPGRRRVDDALRKLFKGSEELALWAGFNDHQICGFAKWRDQQPPATSERLAQLNNTPGELIGVFSNTAALGYAELVTNIFLWLDHPLKYSDLVRAVCALKGTDDLTRVDTDVIEFVPDRARSPEKTAIWGEFLSQLWDEIRELRPLQRIAYLLNFTVADGRLDLFVLYGVAGIRDIGSLLGITPDQYARLWGALKLEDDESRSALSARSSDENFTRIWERLPLADEVLAIMLETDRQGVINLRKAAGERLSRRMLQRTRRALPHVS
jgi:hypothetical protein